MFDRGLPRKFLSSGRPRPTPETSCTAVIATGSPEGSPSSTTSRMSSSHVPGGTGSDCDTVHVDSK